MSAQLSTKLTMDGTQHNETLRNAAKELSKYKREVDNTDRQLKQFKMQSQSATGAIATFAKSFKSGNIDGMMIGASSAVTKFGKSLLGIAGIATAGITVTQWMSNAIAEGTELAKAGEGIRAAFERLNNPNLLDKLREATHGTVTDIELMKQAVKFNDFRLNLDQMGTLLAFAQQKAKDTGQSVDYMVDSIVTGLGRQSLLILDNLGLSAAEVKEEMKKGGDMTTAVAAIIKKQMSAAGDYIETAADRAAKKEAELKNAYEELGRTFLPLKESAGDLFHSMELGIIGVINKLRPLIDMLTTAGQMRQAFEGLGGSNKVNKMLSMLKGGNANATFEKQKAEFWKQINPREAYLKDLKAWRSGDRSKTLKERIDKGRERFGVDDKAIRADVAAMKKMLSEYSKGAEAILHPQAKTTTPVTTTTDKDKKTTKTKKDELPIMDGSLAALKKELTDLQKNLEHGLIPADKIELSKSRVTELNDLISKKEIELGLKVDPEIQNKEEAEKKLKEQIEDIEKEFNEIQFTPKISSFDLATKTNEFDTTNLDGIERQMNYNDSLIEQLEKLKAKYAELGITSGESYDKIIDKIKETKDAQTDLGVKAQEANDKQINWENQQKKIEKVNDTIGMSANMFGTLGDAFGAYGDKSTAAILQVASVTIDSIGQMIPAIMSLVGAKQAESIAGATAAGASIMFPGNIIAIATGIAAVMAAFAKIGSFADGGIIQGRTTIGDYNLARVNGGEMILNTRQQSHLFDLIDHGINYQSGYSVQTVRIKGSDLYLALKNYNGIKKGIGKDIGIK